MDPAVTALLAQLQAVAERLGIEGARLWPHLVFATFVQSVAKMTLCLTVLIGGSIAATFSLWRCRVQIANAKAEYRALAIEERRYTTEPDVTTAFWVYPSVFSSCLALAALFVLMVNIVDWSTGIFAPEVATIMHLMAQVGGRR
jgi:hypothetical protein